MSRLIKLEAENVKRLKAVCIEPNGKTMVGIGGRNGQGKTSVLDCIEYALGGKPDVTQPIRQGESKARVVLETEDLVVTRTFTPKGSRLEVQGKAGELRHVIKSPQALLDKLIGKLAFNPLAFSRMDSTAQLETLKNLVGVDFAPLEVERKKAYEDRKIINREIKTLNAQLETQPQHSDVPTEEVSVSDLAGELEHRMEQNRSNEDKRNKLKARIKEEARLCDLVLSLENQIEVLQKQVSVEKNNHSEAIMKRESWEKLVGGLVDANPDKTRALLGSAEAVNTKVRENQNRLVLLSQMERIEAAAQALNNRIAEIDNEKSETLANAKFPVDGLAFDEFGVTFGGVPFSQCSSAERLRVGVAISLSMQGELKLLLIPDGSLLDADSLRMISEMAEAADTTILIERVGDGDEVSVIIEDGMVKEARKGADHEV